MTEQAPTTSGRTTSSRAARSSAGRLWCATFLLVWVLVGVPALVWSLVTPVFGVADEGAHVINAAAVVRGQALTDDYLSTPGSAYARSPLVTVPGYLAEAETASECFEREPSVPMTCAPPFDGEPAEDAQVVTHVGNYPPLFYLLVGWVTLLTDGADAVVGMRVVSALLCSAVVAAGAATLRLVHRGVGAVAVTLLAVTPMAASLFGSVNPSGVEIALALALWSGMLTFASSSTRALDARLVLVGVLAAALANARPASMVWAAVIVLVTLVLVPPETWRLIWGRRSLWAGVGTAAVGTVVSVVWFFAADPGASLGGPGGGDLSGYEEIGAVREEHLGNLWGYARALVGNIGWLDAPLPPWAVLAYGLAASGVLWTALVLGRWRGVAALLAAILLLVETPVLVQYPNATEVGLIWQGRYSLPLWVGLPVTAYVVLVLGRLRRGQRLADQVAVPAVWVILLVHATMFWVALPRFYVGSGEGSALSAAPGYVGWALLLLVVPVGLAGLLLLGSGGGRPRLPQRKERPAAGPGEAGAATGS